MAYTNLNLFLFQEQELLATHSKMAKLNNELQISQSMVAVQTSKISLYETELSDKQNQVHQLEKSHQEKKVHVVCYSL